MTPPIRMTGMDAAFLELETAAMHLHVVGVLVLRPPAAGDALAPERLVELFADRLHLIPPFRWRMIPVPGGIDQPRWIDDPDFDLDRHVHHRCLGPDAGQDDLERFVGEVASTPLHRDRPLWEIWLADGFADGTVALVTKVHHALMDGAAGGDMMASLFDLEPDPGPKPDPPAWEGDVAPTPTRLVVEAGPAALRRVARVPGVIAHTMMGLVGAAEAVIAQPSSIAGFAPRAPFNGSLTAHRSVAFARCSLEDVREIRRVFATTVNDVVLAATSTSIRKYLLARELPIDKPLVAAVPVAGQRNEQDSGFGNMTSNMMVALPVHLESPVEVLRTIHDGAVGAKAAQKALDPELLDEWIALLPGPLLTAAAQAYTALGLGRFHPPLFNAIVSNVPGPPIPLYLAGARVVATYPMGPLIGNTGLNLTVFSQTGDLDIGVIACPDLVDDARAIAEGFIDGVAELLAAARSSPGAPENAEDPR